MQERRTLFRFRELVDLSQVNAGGFAKVRRAETVLLRHQ